MQLTPNYNLKKPEGADPVDIQDFNDNADVVDAALKKKAESSGGDISEMTVKTLDNITTDFPVPVAGEKPKTFLGKVKKFFEDTKNWMTGVCLIGSIVNNCVTDNAKLPLSAAQGKALMDLYTVLNTNLAGLNARFHFDKVALVQPFFDDAEKSFGFRLYYDVSMTAGYAIHFYFNGEKRITLRFLDIDGVWKVSWTGLLQ
jgi:hypothetical protein